MNNTLQTDSTSQRSAVFLNSIPTGICFDLLLILLCVVAVFGRTLTSYFLADDFGEIHYIHRICSGELNLLLANFTGNYMQISGMSVYRPFLLLSLLIDFLIWKTNAAGFYATNLLFYYLDAALLYLIVLKLGMSGNRLRNRLTALTASALFALSPLHCESVSWVLGRVDIVCAFFYLLSFYLLFLSLEVKSKKITACATAAFIFGLLVKEMAIGIPVIAFLLGWLYKINTLGNSESASIRNGVAFACPYLAATALYFLVRYLALGTLLGGYVAGFGASQEKNALTRWLDTDTLERIAFPIVQGHFQAGESISLALLALYCVLCTTFLVRLLSRQVPLKLFLFLAGWAITTLLPVYKLWGLGYNLEGARFLFFFTMPLATLLAAGLFQNTEDREANQLDRSLMIVSSAVALSLCAIFGYIAVKTDLIWVNAGKEVQAATQQAISILSTDKSNPAVFLGLPKESKGTHMILNGDTFRAAVMPPFANEIPRRKFATFEPVMYSPQHEIDSGRLKSLIGNGAETYVWSSKARQFVDIRYAGASAAEFTISPASDWQGLEVGGQTGLFGKTKEGIIFKNGNGLQGIQLANLAVNPLAADFAVLEIKIEDWFNHASVGASWLGIKEDQSDRGEPLIRTFVHKSKNQFQKVYIPLSRHWKWYEKPSVEKLFLNLPAGRSVVKSIALAPFQRCCPEIIVGKQTSNENGIFELNAARGLPLKVESNSIKDSKSVVLQISKANYFFDNFKENEGAEAVEKEIRLSNPASAHHLDRSDFTGSGFFQMRARALDNRGAPVAAPSECITILVH